MDITFITSLPVVSFLGLALLAMSLYWYKHRNIPPGPRGLPLLGYAPFFGTNPQDTLLKLGEKYGNILSIYMGPQLTIVLNDYEAIKSAFTGQADVFAGRAVGFVFRFLSMGDDGKVHGITLAEGEIWKTTRRFMLQTFRDLGMGKSKLQDRILDEAEYLTNIFAKHDGRPFNPLMPIMCSVSNVVCMLCFGKRYEHDDPEFVQMLENVQDASVYLSQAGPLQSYPILRFFPGSIRTAWKALVRIGENNTAAMKANVQEHRRSYDPNETRDYIDAVLHKQREESESPAGMNAAFHDEELMRNLIAFFGAGTETTTMTMYWSLLFMLHHPEVQAKIHAELDDKIGAGKLVRLEDRAKLPYLEAVCRETQRLANVSPFGVMRANTEETTLMGYRIPKRCFIMPNFKSVNIDPKLWTDPLTFNPNRFLDEQGKVFEPAHFMPFSIGKRACVGEALARMEIFLFFANIMQRFLIRPPRDSDIPSTDEYTTGISCRPTEFKIEAVPR
ncbi:Cytochrome P450 2J2 [Hypsibius exemplaris]|uniref:Cytochrome P450 2J2 n=1 Tax=Hypsibius exemplaris TaxID=2072580 RepID=A0A1W0WKW5_HYPEX|nr:Cytochrome P450 2J2 [Hypsibius exemplaris]